MADTTALVPVFTGTLADTTIQLCDARTLHTFMQVKRDFTTWIKARIRKFGFAANEDYLLKIGSPDLVNQARGGNKKETTDYHLTLDMAKELSMVENNEQGRAARRYFIACERNMSQTAPAIGCDYITTAQKQDLKELVNAIVATGKQTYGETWARLQSKFRVNKYEFLPASKFDEAREYLLGKLPEPEPIVNLNKTKAAFDAAAQAAASVQTAVFNAVLEGDGDWKFGRYLLAFIDDSSRGAPAYVRQMDRGDFITTWPRLIKDVANGECMCSSAELIELATACMQRLQQRAPVRLAA